jgi:NADPH:quinone reductase-like Zn-dependent oxidoreductase
MKAIFFEEHGGLEVLRYGELPTPTAAPGEALIRVRAVALNHLDIWVRRGWEGLKLPLPHIGGSDVVGEIVSVNAESLWKPGTRVIVSPGSNRSEDEWTRRGQDSISPGYEILGESRKGGLAEFVSVPVGSVFKAPEGWSDEEAAASLLIGVTCWRMLVKRVGLLAGESVLIVGSGGGVNSLSILLAKALGADVYVLCGSKDKADRVRTLGVTDVINYSETPRWDIEILKRTRGRGVDVVVDNVGAKTFSKSLRAVARGGRIVTVGNTSGHEVTFDNRLLFAKQISVFGSTMGSKQDFIDAMQFLWTRSIKPIIDRIAPLSDGIKMIEHLESGNQFGKIVLKPS